MPPEPQQHESPRYGAIHRSLLAGLIGSVGFKSDRHEYTGPRALKFNIFPGSGLFKHQPPWVMAAELVQTTRLYARTVARIRPEWVEKLAEHIVRREYSNPRWDAKTLDVLADEKVTLYGMVLIPRRPIPYGPIDPKMSREIFIQQALVEGDWRTDAPFLGHNQRLLRQVQDLEAKTRKRDLLVERQARFDFYSSRVPEEVYNGARFERWRRSAEKHNPAVLRMSLADLLRYQPKALEPDQFPDTMTVAGAALPLQYRFEPGEPFDGVTVTIPLDILSQLPSEPFEWLVPGLLEEKVTDLIRLLPKSLRVNFVPAPDFARSALAEMTAGEGSLLDSLSRELGKLGGLPIPRDAWREVELADHLRMNFRIVDAAGQQLALGRDLSAIRQHLGGQIKASFARLPKGPFNRDNVRDWDFGDLPARVELRRHGMLLWGYPAVVDEGDTAAVRLFDTPAAAKAAMRAGVRRLYAIQFRQDIKHLVDHLPNLQEMSLHYAPLGSAADLKSELRDAIADRAFVGDEPNVRTAMEFELRKEPGWNKLRPAAEEIAATTSQVLAAFHAINLALPDPVPDRWLAATADIRDQLAHLLPRGFIADTPAGWFVHLPRYLKAILSRLSRLKNAGAAKDSAAMMQVLPLWEQYKARISRDRQRGIDEPGPVQFRWMLEEFRVALFAQDVRPAMAVSAKRLETMWEKIGP